MAAGPVVSCPSCGGECRLAPAQIGHTLACPHCGRPFTTAAAPPPPLAYAGVASGGGGGPPSATAVLSLIAGRLFCLPGVGPIATVLGVVGLARTSDGRTRGRGLAVAGLTLGLVGLLVTTLQVAAVYSGVQIGRTAVYRMRSQSNLQKVGLALSRYRSAHAGRSPPDLAALLAGGPARLDPADLVDPSTTDTPAADAAHLLSGGHCSYTYLPPPPDAVGDPRRVVAYETSPAPGRRGLTSVLLGDGSVRLQSRGSLIVAPAPPPP